MFEMDWHIRIGKYNLKLMSEVYIKGSVEELSDIATISIPGAVFNRVLEVEGKLGVGDPVQILLGYNNAFKVEFNGYIKSINPDDSDIKIECEDKLYLFRIPMKNIQLKGATVKSLLKRCCDTVNAAKGTSFVVSCNYDFSYEKFIINNCTAYDVLKKIQEEAAPNVYLRDNTLHVHPRYQEIFGSCSYDFTKNIEKSELKYRKENDRKVWIVVEGTSSSGKSIKVQQGVTGGDVINVKINGVVSASSLNARAQEELKRRMFTGYEGNFTTWIEQKCDAGYQVKIHDPDHEIKDGTYYAVSVETTFSESGGCRKITLGKKLK